FNAGNIGVSVGNAPTIRSNDVYLLSGNNYTGISDQTGINGNISVDPGFSNVIGGDYHLAANSPAIDRGVSVGIAFAGSAPDLGAYESNASGTVTVTTNRS